MEEKLSKKIIHILVKEMEGKPFTTGFSDIVDALVESLVCILVAGADTLEMDNNDFNEMVEYVCSVIKEKCSKRQGYSKN